MKKALEEAEKAYLKGEVPVGAVLVYQKKIISSAHNQVESLKDATAHAEILCLRQGSQFMQNWRLVDTVLYSTLEPCIMCAGAAILSRVKACVWAAPDVRHGGGGGIVDVFGIKHPIHMVKKYNGVLKDASAELMKKFFIARRGTKKKK